MKFLNQFSRNLIKTIAMILLLTGSIASCKKDHDDTPAVVTLPVEGVYLGKYGFDNDTPTEAEKYNVKPGGVIQQLGVVNNTLLAEGTWQLNGNKFTAHFSSIFAPYFEESISTTFDNITGKINGTWGWGTNTSNGGKIELTRQ